MECNLCVRWWRADSLSARTKGAGHPSELCGFRQRQMTESEAMNRSTTRTALRIGALALAALIFLAGRWSTGGLSFPWQPAPVAWEGSESSAQGSVEAAYAGHQSDVWLGADGLVDRVLKDDRKGSRHQRFVVELVSGHTVLVAHNIDLAERVPLKAGDRVEVYGEYEWSDQGGVLHWTHHDPQRRRKGGWIRHRGVEYR